MGISKEISLADLVQANALGRNTCLVIVTTPKGRGSFYIEEGEIVDAAYGDLVGEAAFYALMNAADSTFSASSGVKPTARRIDTGLQTLMLNAMSLRFEGRVPEPTFSPSREPSLVDTRSSSHFPVSARRVEAEPLERTVRLPAAAIPVPVGRPAPPPSARKEPATAVRPARVAPAPAKKNVVGPVIAAGLLLVVAAGAYIVLGRPSPLALPTQTTPAPTMGASVEPIESASLSGAGDAQPELLTGDAPRSPDPESAVSPTIVCRILIGEDGSVREASVYRSRLDLARFEGAAITAVRAYRFRPGRRAGRSVLVLTNFPISFR